MVQTQFTVRQSPFAFIKSLIVIVLLFTLLPVTVAILLDVASYYRNSAIADTLSFNLFALLLLTALQIIFLGLAFLWWYVPTYQIDTRQIVHVRHNLISDSLLALTPTVSNTTIHFGPVGKRLGYGNVILLTSERPKPVLLKNISDPASLVQRLRALIQPPQPAAPRQLSEPITVLATKGEGQHLEFKSSFLWDYRQKNANKSLNVPVMKNVAAFMNSEGGVVLVGIGDDGTILGLEPDLKLMQKPNADSWENNFNMAFNRMIGAEFRRYVTVRFETIDEMLVCALQVQPAPEPAFLTVNGKEDFYIKTGNASQPLSVRQANHYIQTHFAQPHGEL